MNRDLLPVHDIAALSGNNAPVRDEIEISDLPVIGQVPADLNGMYVRNGPNAYYPPKWRYHAYDGDGMVHAVSFDRGKLSYRNRWIQTAELLEEQHAGQSLWTGLKEAPRHDTPDRPLKNTSNTDVKYHAGRLITMWYRSGMPYALDPVSLKTLGTADYDGAFGRISAHSRPDEHTGELLFFDYDVKPPYMQYGVIGPDRKLKHKVDIPLPGPRLPHDMAVTENYTILHDFPLFGDEIVMVGTPYRMHETDDGKIDARRLERTINQRQRDFMLYEWRFNLRTDSTRERIIDDVLNSEFPVINSAYQGRRNQFSYNIVFPQGGREEPRFPGLVKYNIDTGSYVAYSEGPQSFYNEPGFAPRDNCRAEDDGYLISYVWNDREQRSEIQIFDALGPQIGHGPIARILMPQRIPNGFHATYVSAKVMQRWQ